MVAALSVLPGCTRAKREPEYRVTESGEKTSAMGKIFGAQIAPQYGWDGQYSIATLDGSMDLLFGQSMDVLQKLSFAVIGDETRRKDASGQIEAVRQDKTRASLKMAPGKAPLTTEVRVKISSVGDRAGGERVLDEIQRSLRPTKKAAPRIAPPAPR